MKFPQVVYVQHYTEDDPCYLTVHESESGAYEADLGDGTPGERVGVYELKEVVKITRTETFERVPISDDNGKAKRKCQPKR